MQFVDFRSLVRDLRVHRPNWFKLESDPTASDDEILAAQESLGVQLPTAYCEFVREFGGGDFVFGNVYSVSAKSEWNIVLRNSDVVPKDFVALSDNGVGDYYGVRVVNGRCDDEIHFLDHQEEGALKLTEYADLLEYLVDTALRY